MADADKSDSTKTLEAESVSPADATVRADTKPLRVPDAESSSPSAAAPAQLDDLRPGQIVSEKYRIEGFLGRGGMGTVVECFHLELRERVALKFLHTQTSERAEVRARFQREAQISARLKNEHITRVLDTGVWRSLPYIVMEFLVGQDLRSMVRAAGRLPLATALEFTVQLCEGLAEAHAHGVVHRDLKPANVFVTRGSDGQPLVKILDFGVSKWAEHGDELTETGVVLGSPKYMAPEQFFGTDDVDARADVWAVGAILYDMLTGRPPIAEASLAKICGELASNKKPPKIRELAPDVPAQVEAVVMRCFERDLAKRVQSVAELAGGLLEACGMPEAKAVRERLGAILVSAPVDSTSFNGHRMRVRIRKDSTSTVTAVTMSSETRVAALRTKRVSAGVALAVLLGVGGLAALRLTARGGAPPDVVKPALATSAPAVEPHVAPLAPAEAPSSPPVIQTAPPVASSAPALPESPASSAKGRGASGKPATTKSAKAPATAADDPAPVATASPPPPSSAAPPPPSLSGDLREITKRALGDRQ